MSSPTTWEPTNVSTGGSTAVMSNGNLTWHPAANTANQTGIKGTGPGTVGASGGKYYYEATCDTVSANAFQGAGVAQDTSPFTASGILAAVVCANGWWFANATNNGGTGFFTYTTGDVIGIAYDATAQKVWFRKNGGTWNNSGTDNPATGTGGISTANLTGTVVPYSDAGSSSGANGQWTANFGATSYGTAAPSGFGNWPPRVNTNWSTSDFASGTGYNTPILSNGLLTCTLTSNNNNSTVPVSVDGQTIGKYYVEFNPVAGSSRGMAVGIIKNTQSRLLGAGSLSSTGCALVGNGGSIDINGTTGVGSLGAGFTNGTVVGMAVDLSAGLIWFRKGAAGNWNNSGTANPATGTGGISISAITGGLMKLFAWQCSFSSPNVVTTLNAGDTSFVGTTPSGFTAGWPGTVAVTPARSGMFFSG